MAGTAKQAEKKAPPRGRRKAKKKVGAPPQPVPKAKATLILARLRMGKSLRKACRGVCHPSTVTENWIPKDDQFAQHYAQARRQGYLGMADELIEIADKGDYRLMVDTRKWMLSKMLPRVYGDRLALAGDPDSPLHIEMSDVSAAHEITRILAIAQKRKDEALARGEELPPIPGLGETGNGR